MPIGFNNKDNSKANLNRPFKTSYCIFYFKCTQFILLLKLSYRYNKCISLEKATQGEACPVIPSEVTLAT